MKNRYANKIKEKKRYPTLREGIFILKSIVEIRYNKRAEKNPPQISVLVFILEKFADRGDRAEES